MRAPREHTCRIPFQQRVNERGKRHPQGWRFLLRHHSCYDTMISGRFTFSRTVPTSKVLLGFRHAPDFGRGPFY